jgi:hypothetical protein
MKIKIAGYDVLIDDEDFDKVTKINWTLLKKDGRIYFRKYLFSKRKTLLLHRLIINAKRGEIIDHINNNSLDNRKCNLRICTQAQNTMNRKKGKNNHSGYKGVGWVKARRKWQARIKIKGKTIFLGHFVNPKEAHKAYCKASKKYHGKFGRTA